MALYYQLPIIAVVLIAPFLLSGYLTKRWRMADYSGKVTLVLLTLFAGTAICVFGWRNIRLGVDLRGGVTLVYQIMEATEEARQDEASPVRGRGRQDQVDMDKLAASIRRRIDPAGVKEITIRPLGSRQVEMIIPQVEQEEVDRIRAVLASIGSLEFRILATTRNPEYASYISRARNLSERRNELRQPKDATETDENATGERVAFWVPVKEQREAALLAANPTLATREVTKRDGKEFQVLVIDDPYDVTGEYLIRAKPGVDARFRPAVDFFFNGTGAKLFGSLTGSHLPDPQDDYHYLLGIILDGKLESAPQINSTIFGNGIIEGDFTQKQVQNLVDVLNSGALDRALSPEPVSQQYIGPTLGGDTIRRGVQSLVIALLLVFVFAIVYYRFAGMVACIALVMNGILLLGIMIAIRAAFTLPGLAGFALTIAMAVDANVLIYERMREEAHRGAALRMAIRNGFERALSAIVDSNLTTLITAIVLYTIGTDQVRGFAVTLFLGIVLSMYTAVFVARVIFDIAERQRWISRVKMLQALGETHINFLGHKWVMISISVGLIVIGMVGVAHRGRGLLDIDFIGGVSVQAVFEKPHHIEDVRSRLEHANFPDVVVKNVESEEASTKPGTQFIIDTSTPPDRDAEQYLIEVQQALNNEVFKGELSHNSVEITGMGPATAAPAPGPEKSPSAETGGPTKTDHQARIGPPAPVGPDAGLLASLVVGQAEQGNPPPKDASKTEKPGAQKPAGAPTRTQATLSFAYAISHNALEKFIQQAVASQVGPGRTVDVVLSNPKYEEGSSMPYKEWTVQIGLPQNQAQAVLSAAQKMLEETPVFPSSNTVGGAVAKITRYRALYALLASTVIILLYLWVRFQRISYGLGAVASLIHDVLLALGFVALSYYLAHIPGVTKYLLIEQFKVNLTVTTALLTLAGYSLNDTIVVFDRIREVRGKAPQVTQQMINLSINQTLSRTILTGLIAFMVVAMLYILGGPTIHGFAFAMLIGVITGMYSSIYIASPFLLWIARAQKEK